MTTRRVRRDCCGGSSDAEPGVGRLLGEAVPRACADARSVGSMAMILRRLVRRSAPPVLGVAAAVARLLFGIRASFRKAATLP